MIRHLWPLLIGFSVWALAFTALYAVQYLGCYLGWAPQAHRVTLVAGAAIAIAVSVGVLVLQIAHVRRLGPASTFMHRVGIGATVAAIAAAIITFAPVLLASACT
ncbi:hypothetical protein QBK99_03075 [Corticibacterium sp. UT-5YL-CI-8]|nr:hypothetical protein [Tianweitania sp. UT-5YL-CI-8]